MNLNQKFIQLQKIPAPVKIFFIQNLNVMIKAGLPLTLALTTLKEQIKNQKLKLILTDVLEKLKSGQSFAESLKPYTSDFGEIFINMIAAGEASGSLEDVLNDLYLQQKKEHLLKMKIRNALTYPVIIICAMLGIGTFIIVYVMPSITQLFSELKAELPLPTRVLIWVSNFLQNNGLIVVPIVVLAIILFLKIIKTNLGKTIWNKLILKIPIIGEIIKKINIARLSLNLSNLIQTDIAITEAMRITANTLNNKIYQKAIDETSEKIKKGDKIAEILKEYPEIIPPLLVQMMAVGEETGSIDVVLKNLADFYQEDVEQTMENLPVIIEPLLMIVMGVGVAIIALAVILPIYSLTQSF
jgi:type IV pilus assembly protein PilC